MAIGHGGVAQGEATDAVSDAREASTVVGRRAAADMAAIELHCRSIRGEAAAVMPCAAQPSGTWSLALRFGMTVFDDSIMELSLRVFQVHTTATCS